MTNSPKEKVVASGLRGKAERLGVLAVVLFTVVVLTVVLEREVPLGAGRRGDRASDGASGDRQPRFGHGSIDPDGVADVYLLRRDVGLHAEVRPDADRNAEGDGLGVFVRAAFGQKAELVSFACERVASAGHLVVLHDQYPGAGVTLGLRSEEDTSELQSLR